MIQGERSSGGQRRKGAGIRGLVLSFGVAGDEGTGRGDRWRQKLGGSRGCGRFTFRVYTKRVQECKTNFFFAMTVMCINMGAEVIKRWGKSGEERPGGWRNGGMD